MDWYLIAKFIHVLAAILWIGGGFCLLVLGVLADRAGHRAEFLAVVGLVVRAAPLLFVPGSMVVLLSGLTMVWLGSWSFEIWLILGFAGIAATAGIGALALGPTAARILALSARPGSQHLVFEEAQRFLRLAKLDYVLQFAIVFLMVVKPGLTDTALLAGLGIAVLAGLVLTQSTPRRVALG